VIPAEDAAGLFQRGAGGGERGLSLVAWQVRRARICGGPRAVKVDRIVAGAEVDVAVPPRHLVVVVVSVVFRIVVGLGWDLDDVVVLNVVVIVVVVVTAAVLGLVVDEHGGGSRPLAF